MSPLGTTSACVPLHWRPPVAAAYDAGGTMRGDLSELADEELMLLVQDGDTRAFEALYDRHSRAAFSLVVRLVGGRSTAEDVCQEAFLAVWRSRMRYRPELGSVRTWTLGIVHHRAVDALRRGLVHERRRAPEEAAADRLAARERTDVEAARREEGRTVRSALAGLPDDQVRVIELAYFGGLTLSQIAEHLDVPIGTIKGRMRLGLTKLRRTLAAQGVTPS